ncbi:hypothetical protein D3C73_844200 [compost metagenome]
MQDEHRRVRRGLVEFFEGRHAFFGELEFVPATDHSHPLRRRRAIGLVLEHAQRIGQRRHAFPTQFEVVVQTATDQVQVRVVETGNNATALEVDHLRIRAAQRHGFGVVPHRDETTLADRHGSGERVLAVNGMKLAIEQNQIGVHRVSFGKWEADSQGANRRVAMGMKTYTTDSTMVRVIRNVATT